jgi:hypothetical protein
MRPTAKAARAANDEASSVRSAVSAVVAIRFIGSLPAEMVPHEDFAPEQFREFSILAVKRI